jgi:tyrosine-specific transport protein
MNKYIGAIALVSGTCIGSGMIVLPMTLVKIGIIPCLILMFIVWLLIYFTSLINIELNLQSGIGLSLGQLSKKFSGKTVEIFSTGCFKLLSYALLAVYIHGGSIVLRSMLAYNLSEEYPFMHIASIYSTIAILLLLLPIKLMDYVNRTLFIGLVAVITILIAGLVSMLNWHHLPLFGQGYQSLSIWSSIIPVLFTAFGFQVIFHTLTNFCKGNKKMLKSVFLWGSLIPALIYLIWTTSILGVIYQENPNFYNLMSDGKIGLGDLIEELSRIAKWPLVQMLIWWLSLLAMVTSVLGVSLGLCDSIKNMLPKKIKMSRFNNITAAIVTIVPAYLAAIIIPNTFISVLGFAGMILVFIAILIPIYLLTKIKEKEFYYKLLNNKYFIILSIIAGILIITCEIYNLA